MKKHLILSSVFLFALSVGVVVFPSIALAQITNPAIGNLGNSAAAAETGSTFTRYFVTIWRALIFLGGLALLFNLINGAIDWITAAGDSGKIQKGRDKILQSVIGMIILASSFVFVSFISQLLFNFDLLNLTIPTASGVNTTIEGTP